ncbi:ImmA/IrrE family metallo-endopeptidase [Candidatus Accumulibacter vicinus]|uniref:Putative transcription regulator containing HTH domain protein n=1 Tax=Candidatus Accumulibacter vicinus TaxID=2954382 RepID=A0A084Y4N4_9PROT|nr:ImmA/IrrE family metallo-endopeptidase [Candidatus Accumulibacter vicinus]KFB69678.1 MAG: putative transcription regulator containing HTH domain protein [Candidatus Accumulibacter vicinus]
MNQQVRVIKTQRDYDAAIARLSALMDEDIASGSSKEAELELLAVVIESYERGKVAPVSADPIDAILFRMDQMGLSNKDLLPYFGSLSKVSEVLARKRPLSLAMMRSVHRHLDIPADILLEGSAEGDVDLSEEPHYDYRRFPWQEMLARGYFDGFTGDVRQAIEKGEELIRRFMRGFGVGAPPLALLRSPLYQSGARVMDEYALLVWRVAVLKKARHQKLATRYRKGAITEEWLRDLVKLSRFEEGPRLAVEFLANIGIILVVEEHFKKTYLDGAAMLNGDMPVIALTLRHDRVDNFWFALLHELIHVQKHLAPSHLFIADNLDDKNRSSQEEREADEGATEALIPAAEWDRSDVKRVPSAKNASALADKLRIHPAIVAGRVRHETGNWRLLPHSQGGIRKYFNDQLGRGATLS